MLRETATRAANHAIIAFCAYIATALFSPEPLVTLVLCACMCAAFVLRARVLWFNRLCLDTTLMIPYHTIVIVLAVLVSGTQSSVMRRQLLLRVEMQRIKE